MAHPIKLPDDTVLPGNDPLVVLGPNGSGKTRQARQITSDSPVEFVNALRSTRVSPQIPAMGYGDAHNQLMSQKNQARSNHWELTSDFDILLSQLLAENAMSAMQYVRDRRKDEAPELPPATALTHIEELWEEIFPGRELIWKEWSPHINSSTGGEPVTYSGNQMSDGEKSALYLAGKVFTADPGVLVVDEPETHLHSLLAARLWDGLEAARPDVRFVYVTHDLSFALSRQNARYVLASPTEGLKVLDLGDELPDDVAGVLLGSASLSFYARRVVFCEGAERGLDEELYNAWFSGHDTVVRAVGSCEMVLRCAQAMSQSGIAQSLTSTGIIDRDFLPDGFVDAQPDNIHALQVHEVESLLCLPSVVQAVAQHLAKDFDGPSYAAALGAALVESDRHKIILERWKRRLEPLLQTLVASVQTRTDSLDTIVAELPAFFDHTKWAFSPEALLAEEKERVESAVPDGTWDEILRICPGKKFLALAAARVGMNGAAYTELVINALKGDMPDLQPLHNHLRDALAGHLPAAAV